MAVALDELWFGWGAACFNFNLIIDQFEVGAAGVG
jgi:hypothetical protein